MANLANLPRSKRVEDRTREQRPVRGTKGHKEGPGEAIDRILGRDASQQISDAYQQAIAPRRKADAEKVSKDIIGNAIKRRSK